MLFEKKSLSLKVKRNNAFKRRGIYASLFAALLVAGCATQNPNNPSSEANIAVPTAKQTPNGNKSHYKYASTANQLTERHCLERAIFFEANRTSRAGLVGVGTVVMNRVESSHYPNTVCEVVGQKNQFAPGVLTRPIDMNIIPDVAEAADAVLRGERSPKLKNTMHFHTAGVSFPYTNMHYIMVAGGNSFYEKRRRDGSLYNVVNDQPYDVAFALAQDKAGVNNATAALDSAVDKNTSQTNDTVQLAKSDDGKNTSNMIVNAAYKANEGDTSPQKANLADYDASVVPVPVAKASYTPSNAAHDVENTKNENNNAAVKQMTNAVSTPHFKRISAPQSAADAGYIKEATVSDAQKLTVSYKAPDEDKVGEVGAFLLDNSKS